MLFERFGANIKLNIVYKTLFNLTIMAEIVVFIVFMFVVMAYACGWAYHVITQSTNIANSNSASSQPLLSTN